MKATLEILVSDPLHRIEMHIEDDCESDLIVESADSKHCVDSFSDEDSNYELVQLHFNTVAEFKDWFNTTF